MKTKYICDLIENDYEDYIKQTILFNKEIDIIVPCLNYTRPIDKEFINKRIENIKKYSGFPNIKISEIEGECHRLLDVNKSDTYFNTISDILNLSDIERKCLYNCFNAEYYYQLYFDRWEKRRYCSFIVNIMNTMIYYADFYTLFYNAKEMNSNMISNTPYLINLLNKKVELEYYKYPFGDIPKQKEFVDFCNECLKYHKDCTIMANTVDFYENALRVFLPNYSMLSVEDIFEIKTKANDEIEALSDYINGLQVDNMNLDDVNLYIRKKVEPSINELNAKIKNLKLSALQKVLSLRNVAFIPLMVTLLPNLPSCVPLITSAALITADAALDIKKEYNLIKQNPLFFSLKLKKIAKKKK